MFSGVSRALYILLGGAVVGYLVKEFIPTLITGTSVEENINTYLVPAAIFVAVIIAAFFGLMGKNSKKRDEIYK